MVILHFVVRLLGKRVEFVGSCIFDVCRADGIYGEYGQFRAIIASGGQVHWEPGGVFKTVCEIDIT